MIENNDKNLIPHEALTISNRKSSIDERKARRKQLNLRENLSPQ
jgi:hypothetical protein